MPDPAMGVPLENVAHLIQAALTPVLLAEAVLSRHGLRDGGPLPRPKLAPRA